MYSIYREDGVRDHVEAHVADHHPGHHPLQASHLQLDGEKYSENGDDLIRS